MNKRNRSEFTTNASLQAVTRGRMHAYSPSERVITFLSKKTACTNPEKGKTRT